LPGPRGAGAGKGAGIEATFNEGKIHQLRWETKFTENGFHKVLIVMKPIEIRLKSLRNPMLKIIEVFLYRLV
jgi:hypothetical protein